MAMISGAGGSPTRLKIKPMMPQMAIISRSIGLELTLYTPTKDSMIIIGRRICLGVLKMLTKRFTIGRFSTISMTLAIYMLAIKPQKM